MLKVHAQPLGVGHRVQRECVLGRSGHTEEVRPGTRSHDQVGARQGLPVREHQAGWGERDSGHVRGDECHRGVVGEDHPMRPGDVLGGEL
jgi:hypothetical protein